jgi:ribosomal protein S18 acetylase RimI-like enzyme
LKNEGSREGKVKFSDSIALKALQCRKVFSYRSYPLDKRLFFKLGSEINWGLFPCFVPPIPSESIDCAIISPVAVRRAESQDLKSLVDLLTLCFHPPYSTFAPLYPLLRFGIYEDLRSRLRSSSPHYQCLVASATVAEGTSTIVGTAEIALRSSWLGGTRSPYISNFAVSPNYRRQGIGHQLLQRCEQIAQEWNCYHLSLHVLENNQAAKALYFARGYQLTHIETTWQHWLLQYPRRLYLQKKLF